MILEAILIILYQRVLPHKVVLLHMTNVTLCMVCVDAWNCLGCSTVCVLHYKLFQMSVAVDLPMLFLPAEFMPKLRHVSVKKSFRVSLHVHVTLGTLHPCICSLSPLRLEVYFDLSLGSSRLNVCTLSALTFVPWPLTLGKLPGWWVRARIPPAVWVCLCCGTQGRYMRVHWGGRWGGWEGTARHSVHYHVIALHKLHLKSNVQSLSYSHKSPLHNAIRHFSCWRCMQNVICEWDF